MAVTASGQEAGASVDALDERALRQRAFAAARGHSRRVRLLRVVLPILALLAVAAFFTKARFAFPGDLDVSAASLSVTPKAIIMDHPHLNGFDRKQRQYSLVADRAIQPLNKPTEVRLENILAKLEGAGQGLTSVTAEAGNYDHQKRTLQLIGKIRIESAEGYRLDMTGARIDFGAGTLASANPVSIGYTEDKITGDSLSVSGGGDIIVIDGHVRTTLMPPKRAAPLAAARGPSAPAAE